MHTVMWCIVADFEMLPVTCNVQTVMMAIDGTTGPATKVAAI